MTSILSKIGESLEVQPFRLIEFDNTSVVFTADAVVTENYDRNNSVATFPIQKSNSGSDHSMPVDFVISVSAIVSDASMSYFNLVDSAAGSTLGQLAGLAGSEFQFQSKSQRAWNQLNKWMEQSTLLNVHCKFEKDGFKVNEGPNKGQEIPWAIESLGVQRDRNTGKALRYNMNLRMVRQVSIGQTELIVIGQLFDQGAKQLIANAKADQVSTQEVAVQARNESYNVWNLKNLGAAPTTVQAGG